MSAAQQPLSRSIEALVGCSQTIRENLLRIDAALPLIPLNFSSTLAKSSETPASAQATISGASHDRGLSEVPPPKGILAPGGRIPVTSPRPTRRSGRDNSR